MKGRGRRQKGARGENELAQLLTDQLGFVVKRKLGQARDGGDDIQVGKYKIEVKRHERLSVMDWVRQVEATCGVGEVPIVVFRQNGQPWRAVVPLDTLVFAIRESIDVNNEQKPQEHDSGSGVDNGQAVV
jgi:hypothetical protein